MVVANTARGLTRSFDLAYPPDRTSLAELIASGQITALSILRDGVQHALPAPRGFRRFAFGAEPVLQGDAVIGERVFLQAGEIRLSLTSTFGGNVVRTDLVRTGMLRYNPHERHRG